MMRLTCALALFAALAATSANAAEQPYCVGSTGYQTTYITCGFRTFEQCTNEALSMRGWCFPNPYYRASEGRGDRGVRHYRRSSERGYR